MNKGKLRRADWVTRHMVKSEPDTYWVFGDNMVRTGFGGQAGAMRGEPNAIGVPTKKRSGNSSADYFSNSDWYYSDSCYTIRDEVENEFKKIEDLLASGNDVVIPKDGLGTGLSELPTRAPIIYEWIENRIKTLEEKYS